MAVHTVELLEGRDSTNIYNALQKAINMVHERDDKSRNPAILFFTDGVPNVSPARGEIEALKKIQRKLKFNCPIHTYGFGMYNRLNSSMLLDIAVIFGGMNGYISDPTSIGTTFVNGISNILTTAAVNVKLDLGNAINQCK
jgi:Mg-chelatase subunit ChlD